MSLIEDLKALKATAVARINATEADVEALRVSLLGKKGELTALLKGMKDVAPEERKTVGEIGNDVRQTITTLLAQKKAAEETARLNEQLAAETIDVTLPGSAHQVGQPHVLQQSIDEIEQHFLGLGFEIIDDIVDSPEVETDEYNFERENLPKDHPARDMQDTFYITPEILLRTQLHLCSHARWKNMNFQKDH